MSEYRRIGEQVWKVIPATRTVNQHTILMPDTKEAARRKEVIRNLNAALETLAKMMDKEPDNGKR